MWIAVALQAANDIATEDYGSTEYGEAVSFFTSPGEWAESRQRVADCIGRHTDELTRMGRAAIAVRHLRDGPEPVRERVAGSAPHSTSGLRSRPATLRDGSEPVRVRASVEIQPTVERPVPRLTNPAPVVSLIAPTRHGRPQKERRDRQWFITQFMAKQAA
jgi:hypothetical protein